MIQRRILFAALGMPVGVLLASPTSMLASVQDTLVAHRADSIDVVVLPTIEVIGVEIMGAEIDYEYTITSLPTSTQTLSVFYVAVPTGESQQSTAPSGWQTDASQPHWQHMALPGKVLFSWGDIFKTSSISPGVTLGGYSVQSDWLPGLTTYWAQGWTPLPVYASEEEFPDTTVGYTLPENSVSGQTIGPVYSPLELATPGETIAVLDTLQSFACAEEWITSPSVCDALGGKIATISASLAENDVAAAAVALTEFQQTLEAERGGAINESAYSVLGFYALRLRGQGVAGGASTATRRSGR